jgi:hypothetical protein
MADRPKTSYERSWSYRRSAFAASLVDQGLRFLLWVGRRIAGEITAPTEGLDRHVANLDRELFDELFSHGETASRFADKWVGEAERYHEERYYR